MPYRHAHLYLLALIAATVVAFWPAYFAVLATAPWTFHFHGLTATAWMLLLAAQSRSIHDRRIGLHRTLGMVSLFYFPIFLTGMTAVVLGMAQATPASHFYQLHGARLVTTDAPSVVLIGWLFHRAIAERRRVQLHARYMIATVLPLLVPIVGRLASHFIPPLQIHGPADFALFPWGVRIGSAVAIAIAAALWLRAPRHGRPYVVTGAVLVFQAVLFETLGLSPAWQAAVIALGTLPPAPILLATTIVGAGISWSAWTGGARPRRAVAG